MEATPAVLTRPKPTRRWFQFSLLTLLVVATLLAVSFAWYRARVEKQRKAVVAIRKLGGEVYYSYELNESGAISHSHPGCMSEFLGKDYIYHVVGVCIATDHLDEVDLQQLSQLTRLKFLVLWDTEVSDAGLKHLTGLSDLRALHVTGTHVTDAGLEHLKALSKLEVLILDHTCVTDVGLERLKALTKLQELQLYFTSVTDVGVAGLQQALPNVEIYYPLPTGMDRPWRAQGRKEF